MPRTEATSPELGLEVIAYAQAFARRQANPPSPGAPAQLLFELQSQGVDLTLVAEEDLRGVALALGLGELDEQAFLEDAAAWLGRPVP